ncbi:MFS transporter [Bifidobacterium callitrichidarum]|uniref:MFS transporter n=1 Tax=Bifidobacterium callitrichidarum TaxID=2052941 RepID=A0A2U2ND09_9BIFI|nr:MFS transporter [Bifidobacterium callitrichidarum]PWG67002.1 MFS transporter [Bifidobacterium callitrichidarum]
MSNSASSAAGRKLSWVTKLTYALLPLSFTMTTMVMTWQMIYYTQPLAISIGIVTTMLAVGKAIGGFITPVWGYISDRMYSTSFGRKVGRRKGTLLIAAPLNLIFYVLLWVPGMPVWYYLLVNVIYYGVYPGINTVVYSLPSEMTDDSKDRAQLVAIQQIGGGVGGFALSMFNAYLFKIWGADSWQPYFKIAMIYAVLGTVLLVIGALCIKERPYDETTDISSADKGDAEKVGFFGRLVSVFWNFLSVLRIKTFRNYLGIFLSQLTFRTVRGQINAYFIMFVLLLTPAEVSLSTGFSFLFGMVCVVIWATIITKLGGMRAYRLGSWFTIILFIGIFILGLTHGSMPKATVTLVFTILITLFTLGNSGIVNAQTYVQSFVPDVDELVTGKRREGQYAGIQSTLEVIVNTLVTILVGVILQAVGFQSGADVKTQSPLVVNVLLYMYCGTVVVLALVGILLTYRMHLNEKNHDILVAESARLRNGGSMDDVTAETRKVVEDLAGMPYEQCWGHNNVINATNKG